MKTFTGIIVVLLLLIVSGCKSTIKMPSYLDQPIATYNGNENTLKGIDNAIIKAAVSLGWRTQIKDDGKIVATLDIRQHQLVVLITHDTKNVSIEYVDSTNLKYDGSKIHRQYANWITNLLRAINANNLTS